MGREWGITSLPTYGHIRAITLTSIYNEANVPQPQAKHLAYGSGVASLTLMAEFDKQGYLSTWRVALSLPQLQHVNSFRQLLFSHQV